MQSWYGRRTGRHLLAVVGLLAGALAFLGCPGGDEAAPPRVAATDAVLNVNRTTVQALEGQTFTFASGAVLDPGLANQPLTLTFTDTATATPTFTFTSPTLVGTDGRPARATGTTQFGSCSFVVVGHSFQAGQAGVRTDQTITIDPCTLRVTTQGLAADSLPQVTQILLQLGLSTSAPESTTVAINPRTGTIVLKNINTGVTVALEVTGLSGTSL